MEHGYQQQQYASTIEIGAVTRIRLELKYYVEAIGNQLNSKK